MKFKVWKYDATGNDFIIIDNRDLALDMNDKHFWASLCDRENNIGSDGVIFLVDSKEADFKMVYLNSDGGEAEMCGNGARSICHFAHNEILKHTNLRYEFETHCGTYHGEILDERHVRILMTEIDHWGDIDISDLFSAQHSEYIQVGVPHCVFEIDRNLDELDIIESARDIRYHSHFKNGANVNFAKLINKNTVAMRTYERGVENETKSCGTGTVATALTFAKKYSIKNRVNIIAPGGHLSVGFDENYSKVWLEGPVSLLFSREVEKA